MIDKPRRSSLMTLLIAVAIFAFAFALRWPSCGESFWVDELHTAWCVSGPWDQVSERAGIGNQQSGYFAAAWVWYRLLPDNLVSLYGTEAMLRLTSVLLVSASAAWLSALVRSISNRSDSANANRWIGGIAAGAALAVENNAIFFGTELRPYAAVLFLTTATLALWQRRERAQGATFGMHLIAILAAMVHVTSLIVLAPLLAAIALGDAVRRRGLLVVHLIAAVVWCVLAVWWCSEHAEIWDSRSAWASFAVAGSWRDVWRMWPWLSLVVLPGMVWCFARHASSRDTNTIVIVTLVLVVVFSTFVCFALSRWNVVALWHRRYLVASLPMLCLAFGLILDRIEAVCFNGGRNGWLMVRRSMVAGLAVGCLLLMMYRQPTLAVLSRGEVRLVQRGEDWRSAIRWARQQMSAGEIVWIDAGLIEQNDQPLLVDDPRLEEYLRYVTAGPYRLDATAIPIGVGSGAIKAWDESSQSKTDLAPAVLITRRPVDSRRGNWMGRRFGRVKVLIRR